MSEEERPRTKRLRIAVRTGPVIGTTVDVVARIALGGWLVMVTSGALSGPGEPTISYVQAVVIMALCTAGWESMCYGFIRCHRWRAARRGQ